MVWFDPSFHCCTMIPLSASDMSFSAFDNFFPRVHVLSAVILFQTFMMFTVVL